MLTLAIPATTAAQMGGATAVNAADAAMSRYAAGDDSAFAELYDLVAPRLHGYLYRQTRNQAGAEDLVQQTLLNMHQARGHFRRGAEVMPWAFAIARRLMIDGIRKGKYEVLQEGDQEAPGVTAASPDAKADDWVQAKQVAARLDGTLRRLPEAQRAAFELVKLEGLSLSQAAQVLGTTVIGVKLRLHRASQAMKDMLGQE